MTSLRDTSRATWSANTPASLTDITAGSLQRIADACEAMSKSWVALRDERDKYERWYRERTAQADRLRRSASALRGTITRMKKKRDGAR